MQGSIRRRKKSKRTTWEISRKSILRIILLEQPSFYDDYNDVKSRRQESLLSISHQIGISEHLSSSILTALSNFTSEKTASTHHHEWGFVHFFFSLVSTSIHSNHNRWRCHNNDSIIRCDFVIPLFSFGARFGLIVGINHQIISYKTYHQFNKHSNEKRI